ncbi:MAG: helix-turn-helix transcriptional regulator [Orrella sp.]|jgi:HTH-type transcriptional regulator / antitoxin HipB|nr:helix-turn-helix domain-containing protein [Burkholderiales bacterium]
MTEFTVHTSEHFSALLQGFRRQAGLTQAEMAKRLGVTQQTLSAFERNAEKASAERLLEYLSILGVDLVLRQSQGKQPAASASDVEW